VINLQNRIAAGVKPRQQQVQPPVIIKIGPRDRAVVNSRKPDVQIRKDPVAGIPPYLANGIGLAVQASQRDVQFAIIIEVAQSHGALIDARQTGVHITKRTVAEIPPNLANRPVGGVTREKNVEPAGLIKVSPGDRALRHSRQADADVRERIIAQIAPQLRESGAAKTIRGSRQQDVQFAIVIVVAQSHGTVKHSGQPRVDIRECAVAEVPPDLGHRAGRGIACQKNIQLSIVVEITKRHRSGIDSRQGGLNVRKGSVAEVPPDLREINWKVICIHPGEAGKEEIGPSVIIKIAPSDGAAGDAWQGGIHVGEQTARFVMPDLTDAAEGTIHSCQQHIGLAIIVEISANHRTISHSRQRDVGQREGRRRKSETGKGRGGD